jgi:RND family efflux transporter MFP subunit
MVAIGIALTGVGCGTPRNPPQEPGPWIRVVHPDVQDRPESYPFSGTVVPQGAAQTLSFLVPGRVVKVALREGQAIRRGQELGALEQTSYGAALEAAAAQARAAKAAMVRAQDESRRMKYLFDRQSLAENDFLKFKLAEQAAVEQYRQAQANETVARKNLSDTTLRALVGGVVTRRLVEPGVMAAAGQPAFEIAQVDPVEVQIGIPETLVGAMRIGQAARVTLPASPGASFDGTLRVINAAADPASRTYMGRIAVGNPKGLLHLGMVAEARIQGDRRESMLLVPYEAVVKDPQGASIVYEYEPGALRVVARRVVLGALEGRKVQVQSGLEASSQVVVAGQHSLRDGERVRLAATEAEPQSGKN